MSEQFFETDEVNALATSHARKVLEAGTSEADRLIAAYRRVRGELRDRLDILEPGTFTAQKLRGALVQIDAAMSQMNRILSQDIGDAVEPMARLGIENLLGEIRKWNERFVGLPVQVNVDAAVAASSTKNLLLSRYESSVRSYSESLRSRVSAGLTDSLLAEDSLSEVVNRISRTFLTEEWRLQMIARTELHNAYNVAKLTTMGNLADTQLPDLKKTLFHPMDSRTGKDSKRLNRNNPIVSIDEPFVESSTGRTLSYMAPPNRPNDRAILIPYRESWAR